MANLDGLKSKLGYLPNLTDADFKVFHDLSFEDVRLLAHGKADELEILQKAKLYADLKNSHSLGNSCTAFTTEQSTSKLTFADVTFVNDFAFLTSVLHREISVYTNLIRVATSKPVHLSVSTLAKKCPALLHGKLSDEQISFVSSSLSGRVNLLSGGPGMGKTQANKQLVKLIVEQGIFDRTEIAILGSTNKCLSSYSDLSVNVLTVHKALGFNPYSESFSKGFSNKLQFKFIIVEESTLLDLKAMSCLLESINDDAHIVLCGDKDQFGCVGVGDVFYDLCSIELGDLVRKNTLTKNFRSNTDISSFLQFLRGDSSIDPKDLPSVNIVKSPLTDESYYEKLLKILLKFQSSGFSVLKDLQILSPIYAGLSGIDNVNAIIHKALTEDNFPIDVGDKITIGKTTTNFTQGEQSIVIDISKCGSALGIKRKDDVTFIRQTSMPKLSHCMSIHESQGSEWNHGLVLLNRSNLDWLGFRGIHTASSRFKDSLTLYGDVDFSDLFNLQNNSRNTLAAVFGHNSKALLTFIQHSIS